MQDPLEMNSELQGFEARLAGLMPTSPDAVRDRIMFEAGRQSGHRGTRMWRGLAAVLAVGLALSLWVQPTGKPAQIVERDTAPGNSSVVSSEIAALPPASESAYLRVRRRVLEEGLGALPAMETAAPTRVADKTWPDAL